MNVKKIITVALAVCLLSILLVVPAFAVVTESSGDGLALYGPFLLADVGDKWDSSLYPNAMIGIINGARYGYSGSDGYVFVATDGDISIDETEINVTPKFGGNGVMTCFMTNNAAFNDFVVNNTTFEPSVNEWGVVETQKSSLTISLGFTNLWSNFAPDGNTDPYNNSTYYSLDGMNIIEWDGNTTGLVGSEAGYYIVDSYVNAAEAYAVYKFSDGYSYVADIIERTTTGGLSWYLKSESPFFIPVMASEEQDSITFVSETSQSNNQQIITKMMAYRSVESPPDEGGGDDDSQPPSGG